MRHDLRFAVRLLVAHRWFSAAVLAILALGIGINTTVFTLVNAVLFKPLPFEGGERLVTVANSQPSQGRDRMNVSWLDFLEYRSEARAFEALHAVSIRPATLGERGVPPERYRMGRVTVGQFEMLHVRPVLGRGFEAADGAAGAAPVILLSHAVWQDRYGGDAGVTGRAVRLNEQAATIVGVMPEGFRFPVREDLWIPLVPGSDEAGKRGDRSLIVLGMLRPGAGIAEAAADLDVVSRRLESAYPDTNKGIEARVFTFHERFNGGEIRLVFLLMLAAVGLVLLIACANVANMLLSRALARRREVSIRAAMGASRWQITRQLLTESVLLSGLGGLLGLGIAAAGISGFDRAVANVNKPYWIDFSMDYVVFAYFAAVCVASGILFGLAPAWRAARVDLNDALKDGQRTTGGRTGRLAGLLVVVQFTLAVVLLAAAGLFARSFLSHLSVNAFVPAGRLLTALVALPEERYPDPAARLRFFDEALVRLPGLPGVERAAATSSLPGMGAIGRRLEVEGTPADDPERAPAAAVVVTSPGLFATIDLPLLLGRDFEAADGEAGREAAIVTRGFAARFWPDQPPIGRRFRFFSNGTPGPWLTVVGLSADVLQRARETETDPVVFVPLRQEGLSDMALMVRTAGPAGTAAAAVRAEIQAMDQDLALFGVRPMTEAVDEQRWYLRVFGTLFGAFALTALLMAAVGIYAVTAQSTGRRTQEIGVRMALGATAGDILRLVLARGLWQLGSGLAIGLVAAYFAMQLLSSLLFRVSASDPGVFASVAALLVAVGLLACWLPARRASTLPPTTALRCE